MFIAMTVRLSWIGRVTCAGSGTTLRAAHELERSAYGFEIDRTFYSRAKEEMLSFKHDGQMSIDDFPEVLP